MNEEQKLKFSNYCLAGACFTASKCHTPLTFNRITDAEFCHFFKIGPLWVWWRWLVRGLSGFISVIFSHFASHLFMLCHRQTGTTDTRIQKINWEHVCTAQKTSSETEKLH